MTFISCLISLKNVASGWVLKNTLDMLCPLKYLLMSLIRFPYVLNLSLLRNPINTAVAFTVFVGSRIPLSNHSQISINKLCQVLIMMSNQELLSIKNKDNETSPLNKNRPKDKLLENWGN